MKIRIFEIIAVLILLVFGIIIVQKPSIIGYVVLSEDIGYQDKLDLIINESGNYSWFLAHPGNLKEVKISGSIIGYGYASIYLEYDNLSLLIANISRSFNYTKVKQADNLKNESIRVELNYLLNNFDPDNDGVTFIDDIIDFYIKAYFNRDIDYSKLCTLWQILNVDNKNKTIFCYGNEECCNLVGLIPYRDKWNSTFYVSYGKFSGYNNIVSARVIYANYSINISNMYADIVYSEWKNLSAIFVERSLTFKDICLETCSININSSYYILRFVINNVTLKLENISYVIRKDVRNKPPRLIGDIPNIEMYEIYKVNLSKYFYDEDNLSFNVSSVPNLTINIFKDIAYIMADKGFFGNRSIVFWASDGYSSVKSNEIIVRVKTHLVRIMVNVTQSHAVIGQPVKWVKIVKVPIPKKVEVKVPSVARNLNVRKIINNKEVEANWSIKREIGVFGIRKNQTLSINDVATEYIIEYETPPPYSIEKVINPYKKVVTIGAPLHYKNILAFTSVKEVVPLAKKDLIKIYHLQDGKKNLVDFSPKDENKNGLIDKVEWIVPHLSNQSYEVSITILNVKSYPTVGGSWTVKFETVGIEDLVVKPVNGTRWALNESYDLKFIEIKCNNTVMNYSWINDSVYVYNYSCSGTGYETSKVLTPGVHTLEFKFGDQVAYASNLASLLPRTLNIQGRLENASGETMTGNFSFTFRIYNVASGGTPLWEETQIVEVEDGIYDTILGTINPILLEFNQSYYLGIEINNTGEMSPRLNLTSTPYTFTARKAELALNLTCTDCLGAEQIQDIYLFNTGDTMFGSLNMSGNRITDLANPIEDYDAATKAYVDQQLVSGVPDIWVNETGDVMSGNLTINANLISNKIGIGTSEPRTELDVIGNTIINGTLNMSNKNITNINNLVFSNEGVALNCKTLVDTITCPTDYKLKDIICVSASGNVCTSYKAVCCII